MANWKNIPRLPPEQMPALRLGRDQIDYNEHHDVTVVSVCRVCGWTFRAESTRDICSLTCLRGERK